MWFCGFFFNFPISFINCNTKSDRHLLEFHMRRNKVKWWLVFSWFQLLCVDAVRILMFGMAIITIIIVCESWECGIRTKLFCCSMNCVHMSFISKAIFHQIFKYSTTEMSSDLSKQLLDVVDFIPNHKYLRLKNGLFCFCDTYHYVQCYSYNSYVELEHIACFILQLILTSFSRLLVYKQKVWVFVVKFSFIYFSILK